MSQRIMFYTDTLGVYEKVIAVLPELTMDKTYKLTHPTAKRFQRLLDSGKYHVGYVLTSLSIALFVRPFFSFERVKNEAG